MGLLLGPLYKVTASGVLIVNTGYASSWSDAGGGVRSGVDFHQDGYVEDVGPGLTDRTKVIPGEYWSLEPDTNIGTLFELRCASINSGVWTNQAASVGSWVTLDVGREWNVVSVMAHPSVEDCNGDFEFGDDGAESADQFGIFSGFADGT